MKLPDFPAATASYEHWLEQHLTLLPHDLELKHQQMAAGAFPFFRATFYRWMQLWFAGTAAAATKAPAVLAVGDLHVENFGTWRDSEGRLVWGVNDFDEAYRLPYTLDLVRLAASAHLAIDGAHLSLPHDEACDAILAGYSEGIAAQGMPFVLAEKNSWLRALVSGELREPEHFWSKLDACVTLAQLPPASAVKAVTRLLPDPKMRCRWVHRVAGVGSLGRQRFVALGVYAGSQVAREAKALAPSACVWAANARARRLRAHYLLPGNARKRDPRPRPLRPRQRPLDRSPLSPGLFPRRASLAPARAG